MFATEVYISHKKPEKNKTWDTKLPSALQLDWGWSKASYLVDKNINYFNGLQVCAVACFDYAGKNYYDFGTWNSLPQTGNV